MFEDLCDSISFLWAWRWPTVGGEITAVNVERIKQSRGGETLRLAIAYKFSVGEDGPYAGESFWEPLFFCKKRRILAARRRLRTRQHVLVRYRPDDPSVNTLDRVAWKDF